MAGAHGRRAAGGDPAAEKRKREYACVRGRDSGTQAGSCTTAADTEKEESVHRGASARSNRERASQMNVRYVVFLTAAAVATVWMCVNYLQLEERRVLRLQKQVTALRDITGMLRSCGIDSDYNRIMAGVGVENSMSRMLAVNELGMGYATKNQVQTYSLDDSDYVHRCPQTFCPERVR